MSSSEEPSTSATPAAAQPRARRTEAELRELVHQIVENPEKMRELDDDDVIEVSARINPIGTFIPANPSHAVISLINMKEKYMRELTTTAMIGFIYRRLEEYEPDFVTRMEESYAAQINKIVADSAPGADDMQKRRDQLREECTRRSTEYKNANRTAIRAFLDSMFRFNPDKHVRKIGSDDLPEDARDIIEGRTQLEAAEHPETKIGAAFADVAATLRAEVSRYNAPDVRESAADIAQTTYEHAEIVYRNSRVAEANCAQAYGLISKQMTRVDDRQEIMQLEDTRQLLETCRTRFASVATTMGPYAAARSVLDATHPLAVIPPADVFHQFGRYFDSHYETLRLMTDAIYNTTSDIENILIYYDAFDTEEKAREFMRVHEADFRAEPMVVENGGVTLLGPFRENRARVDFYTRNTEVLRLMMEQLTRDQQLGKDMTKKRVVAAKRRNVRETGPDDAAGLESYLSSRQIISQFGQRPQLSREERTQLALAEQTRAEYETPDGALAVRVLAPQLDEEGRPVDLQQSFFYTEATHVQK